MTLPYSPHTWSTEARYCLLERTAIMLDSGVPDAPAKAEAAVRRMAAAGMIEEAKCSRD